MYQSYWKDTNIKEVDEDAKISAKGITEKYTLAIALRLFILTYFFKCSQTMHAWLTLISTYAILKTARMTSTHWPHQHFELLSFLAHLNNAWFIKSGRVIKPKICRPGPRGLYNGLPTPLKFGVEFLRTISRFRKRKKISLSLVAWSIKRKIRRVRVVVDDGKKMNKPCYARAELLFC